MQVFESVWMFIQDQILGMKWLSVLLGNLLSSAGLDNSSKIGGSVQFFIYDVIKIVALLCVLILLLATFSPISHRKELRRFLVDFME